MGNLDKMADRDRAGRRGVAEQAGPNQVGSQPWPVRHKRDCTAAWAAYTQLLRRAHLHTVNGTKFPMPMHQASLADEYLK